ncbi:MAG: hypothetical protein LUE64_01855 [Candidatus Gastranaerophilales bacterium]|nr:hypothetical protein [Candidatus Gastranaerophilales bacterium]
MNVNGLNTNQYLIDSKSASSISESLFSALQKKSVDYSKTNLSGFTRNTLGVDLYNTKTDLDVQRQIAITNSGAFDTEMNLTSVQQLNSFAAAQLYSSNVSDSLGGKITINAAISETDAENETEDIQNLINVYETDKDKQGSNPFAFGGFFDNSNETEQEQA